MQKSHDRQSGFSAELADSESRRKLKRLMRQKIRSETHFPAEINTATVKKR